MKRGILFIFVVLSFSNMAFAMSEKQAIRKYARSTLGSKFFDYNGQKIHYRIQGKGPTLVLIHGTMDSLHSFNQLVSTIEDRFQVIRVDVPGMGLSDFVGYEGDPIDSTNSVVHALLEKLNVKKFILGGHSLGGIFAWTYALQFPGSVEQLVLIAPAAYPQKLPKLVYLGRRTAGVILDTLPTLITEPLVRTAFYLDLKLDVLGDPDQVVDLDGKVARMTKLFLSEGNVASYVQVLESFRKYDFHHAKMIPRLNIPIHLIFGDQDKTVPASQQIEFWLKDQPQAKVHLFKGVGHYPHWERVKEVSQIMRAL